MRELNLSPGDPLALTLAADARLSPTDYMNDQIWELLIGKGEPPSLALSTTFGLRARGMRIFPRFIEGDIIQSEPGSFPGPVQVRRCYPNYIQVEFAPVKGINVQVEYWVPDSHTIAARTSINNLTLEARNLQLEWVALLNPSPDGQRMLPELNNLTTVLAGKTANLELVFWMTGGAKSGSGPFPSLILPVELASRSSYKTTWVLCAKGSLAASIEQAQNIVARNWDAQAARLVMTNANVIDIHTGEPEWDAAFALAQKTARGLFIRATDKTPASSFVTTRLPDHGYSMRGDGSDYNHLWNGQTALDAYYLADLLLPAEPELVKGVLENFLSTQAEDGSIDWKPGLAGQRGGVLATPLLASLAWRIYLCTQERAFIESMFPRLLAFYHSWFLAQHDRDGDGVPEWDHPNQTGFEDHPVFSQWHEWSQGVDITTTESPDLCSFLYQECQSLLKMAFLTGQDEAVQALEASAQALSRAVESAWEDESSSYCYWDRDSHHSPEYRSLGQRQGAGYIYCAQTFPLPVRLLIRIQSSLELPREITITIHGKGASGSHRIENIPGSRVRWHASLGFVTSERIYSEVEFVEIQAVQESDWISLETVRYSYQDQTTLLPLWAGIPGLERAQSLVKDSITSAKRFWSAYGIRACVDPDNANNRLDIQAETLGCQAIYMPWNTLIGEGLVRYGYRKKAAELVSRLMKAVILNLKQDLAFHRVYDASTGKGSGEFNALGGLAPLGLFMETLGVHIITQYRVELDGFNPFPWPVTVKYLGLTIVRQKSKSMVIFPDGQNMTVKNDKPLTIHLD